ncbi:RAM signaling network component [Branchiostoma belcheri]|nr:RAM signaling network component [Branchiostoma belcheri]
MGKKQRHLLIFFLIILKELNTTEEGYCCRLCDNPSSHCSKGLDRIPENLPTSISETTTCRPFPRQFYACPKLLKIELHGNPWQCDCRMALVKLIDAFETQITCAKPAKVQGRKLPRSGQGQSQAITISSTNYTATVMTSGDDHQYEDIDSNRVKTGQGQSQTNPNTATVVVSGHDQTYQGQYQPLTKSNTNTTATVMTSGHDQTGQYQPLIKSNTNTTATVMVSGHDQTYQGQYQPLTKSNTNTTATVMTSGHDQTGQYQPLIKSNTNTIATVMVSRDDHKRQGQSQLITESLESFSMTYERAFEAKFFVESSYCNATGPTPSQLKSL